MVKQIWKSTMLVKENEVKMYVFKAGASTDFKRPKYPKNDKIYTSTHICIARISMQMKNFHAIYPFLKFIPIIALFSGS